MPRPFPSAAWIAFLFAACARVTPVAPPPTLEAPADPPTERWTWLPDESFERGPIDGTPGACGADVVAGIRALGLRGVTRDTTSCEVRTYGLGERRVRVARVEYGEEMDCPSGCIQEEAAMVLRDGRVQPIDPARAQILSLYTFAERFLERELPSRGVPLRDPGNGRPYGFYTATGDYCLNAYHRAIALVTRGDAVWWSLELPETVCRPRASGPGWKPADYEVVLAGEIVFPLKGSGPMVMDTQGLRLAVRPWSGTDD
ncbi:MAG: hypothetical protein AAGH15_04045 [Myxococcota bacterium]